MALTENLFILQKHAVAPTGTHEVIRVQTGSEAASHRGSGSLTLLTRLQYKTKQVQNRNFGAAEPLRRCTHSLSAPVHCGVDVFEGTVVVFEYLR